MSILVKDIGLSGHVINPIMRYYRRKTGINGYLMTIDELCQMTAKELLKINGIGEIGLSQLESYLASCDRELRKD